MTLISQAVHLLLHIDTYLRGFMLAYGGLAYVVMFLVIFCETGLVFTPFLPGDSLIFAAGALGALGIVSPWACLMFMAAAILGNMLNYRIGRALSVPVKAGKVKFIKAENITRTEHFFKKYGAVTIILTRFMPIIRTFAPFVAGMGRMPTRKFLVYNAFGGILWAGFFFGFGFFLGNLPFFKTHFSMVVVLIVVISLLPAVIGFIKSRFPAKNSVGV